jgi:hypothetical protein
MKLFEDKERKRMEPEALPLPQPRDPDLQCQSARKFDPGSASNF